MKYPALVVLASTLFSLAALAAPQDLANEEWVMKPKEAHSLTFTLTRDVPVRVEAVGVKDADKGFTIKVVRAEYLDACINAAKSCNGLGGFNGPAVRAFDHTETIPAGRWAFFVMNTENIFKRTTVRVHVVVDPGGG